MRARLGVCFVGGGWVSLNRHMPAAKAQTDLDLVGLVSEAATIRSLDRARLGRVFGIREFASDLGARWFDAEVDVVVIGTPPDTHHDIVMRCLGMGKHVLVEKPFALEVTHAAEMVDAAKAAQKKLGVVHNLQFSRACLRARELYEAGEIGELRRVLGVQSSNVRRRLPRWFPSMPMGLFTDESPHLIYLLSAFADATQGVSATVGPPLAENDSTPRHVSAHFSSTTGPSASFNMFFDSALSEWHLVIFGGKRTLVADLFRDILIQLPDDRRHGSLDVLRTSWHALRDHASGFLQSGYRHLLGRNDYGNKEVFRRFISAVREGSPLKGIAAEDGARVVAIMEQIQRAARAPRSHSEATSPATVKPIAVK